METRTLDTIVKEIKLTKKEFNITPRFLFKQRGYERRTLHNCSAIDKYLEENLLEVVPHYNDVWIDHTITLKHKDIAKLFDIDIHYLKNNKYEEIDNQLILKNEIYNCISNENLSYLQNIKGGIFVLENLTSEDIEFLQYRANLSLDSSNGNIYRY